MIKANFHTHTILCDGKNTPREMAEQALALGFTTLGYSGHMDNDIHMDYPEYDRQIRGLQQEYAGRLDILRGVELDTLFDPEGISRRENRSPEEADKLKITDPEYIIGSTHFLDVPTEVPMSVDNTPEMMEQLCTEFFGGDYYKLAKHYYDVEARVYERTKCTFVGHFDLVSKFNDQAHMFDESDPRYRRAALNTMEYLVSLGLPFEINCGAMNRGMKKEAYPNPDLLRSLKEMGGQILINADAHNKELLNGGFDKAEITAKECGFDHVLYLKHDATGKVVWEEFGI